MYEADYEVRNARGHYEVYKNGKFLCSADTMREALDEIDEDKEENE